MLAKLIGAVILSAALVAGGGATWKTLSPSAKDAGTQPHACCSDGSDCYPGSPACCDGCGTLDCECCYAGSPCCGDDCCPDGAPCCTPAKGCCGDSAANK
jgi:hypothetical protein